MTDDNADERTDESTQLTSRRGFLAAGTTLGVGALATGGFRIAGAASKSDTAMSMVLRIENVSTSTTLTTTADGELAEQPVPVSPGAYAVHSYGEPIFSEGEPERGNGLEEVAEDGKPGKLAGNLAGQSGVHDSGAFASPVGSEGPGPLLPGHAYETELQIDRNTYPYLSFAFMFIPSNDVFFAPGARGFALLPQGDPLTGDVTDRVGLWDAGTEVNQEPGVGDNQAQRQRGLNVGDVEREVVEPIADINGYDYPAVEDVVEVTLREA